MLADIDQNQVLAGHQGRRETSRASYARCRFPPGRLPKRRTTWPLRPGARKRNVWKPHDRGRASCTKAIRRPPVRSEIRARLDDPVAHDIQGFEVVAGMNLMPLETRVVAANDMQVEILDADLMQIGRHLIGRC